jgi:hypothetical protein
MLVVLPFENLGRSDDDSFAEGITDEIRNQLASIGSLGVIGRIMRNLRLQFVGETQVQCGERKHGTATLQRALASWDRLPRMAWAHTSRARCLAYLGRREDALREARSWPEWRGVDQWARNQDKEQLAEIYAVCGDAGEAINTLEQLSHVPTLTSAEDLSRHPKWAPLRADPRFAKLLAGWKPL